MLRSLVEEFLIFILPFAVFAGWLIIRRRNPLDVEHWRPHVYWLCITGLLLAIASLLYAGVSAPRHMGAFAPPHVEGGRLVPGQFNDK
jgi:hypothetical protein